ncbi:MAG: dicarboxylate/amino acid:cation symporter [Bryobacterales bacterium]|nr:dicarboxylate/amino acid:cation symporter [Bryobacterales bacterium]
MSTTARSTSMLSFLRSISLAQWMLLAAVGGIAVGFLAPEFAKSTRLISDIFLRLIRAIIAPVLFGVLIRAIGGGGAMRDLGRIGWKSLVIFEVFTTLALLLGWFGGLVFQPGAGMQIPNDASAMAQSTTFSEVILNAIPTSIFDSMARGDVLQIVVFCFLFGLAALSLGEKAKPVLAFADSVAEIAFRATHLIMLLAPAAVFSAMGSTIATSGEDAFYGLARFSAVAWALEAFFLLVPLVGGLLLFQVPLRRFIYFVREPFLVAFATTSSAAALPQALENMQRFGVSKRVIGFVAPLSLSLNMNGSTIYLALGTLFVAQAAGVALSFETQVMMLLTLKLTSKGVAGIPRANFVILTALFQSHGLPLEGLAMLLGVDAIIDTIRTSVNITSHCAAPAMVARWEGEQFPEGLGDAPEPAR